MRTSESHRNLLFELLRAGLDTAYIPQLPATIDTTLWHEVYRLANDQGIAAIVYDGFMRLASKGAIKPEMMPERTLKIRWALNVERIEGLYGRHRKVIAQLAEFLAGHDIKTMILKGYGLSLRYPHPEHRPCGDIDIWLFGEQDRADRLLNEKWGTEVDNDHHHHTVLMVDGVMIENHYDFLNIHAHLSNRDIERELQRLARMEGTTAEVGDATIYLPPADFNALFLLRHAAAHFAAVEIGLRHVVDWAMFLKAEHTNVNWEALYGIARKMNMYRFLNAMNAIVIDYMGVDEAWIPLLERDAKLEERVLNDILHPEFDEPEPKGIIRKNIYRMRRWWANRWKHRIVYSEGLLLTFLVQIRSHLLKPLSFR